MTGSSPAKPQPTTSVEFTDADINSVTSKLAATQLKPPAAAGSTSLRIPSFDTAGVAELIRRSNNIIVMTGAGVSTSCGIPDFRSPSTGLYANLQKYNLPSPEAMFSLDFFRQQPLPFFQLARELMPSQHQYIPSPTHFFQALLQNKQKLLRCYTQNIDTLELLTPLSPDRLIQAHGGFHRAACIDCHHQHTAEHISEAVNSNADIIPRCVKCKSGIVKPSITFFGEALPPEFFTQSRQDLPKCDLLLVMGTSLVVHPFAGLVDRVGDDVPRVLINREKVNEADSVEDHPHYARLQRQLQLTTDDDQQRSTIEHILQQLKAQYADSGFDFSSDRPERRDIYLGGSCDDVIYDLAAALGWKDELNEMIATYKKQHKPANIKHTILTPDVEDKQAVSHNEHHGTQSEESKSSSESKTESTEATADGSHQGTASPTKVAQHADSDRQQQVDR